MITNFFKSENGDVGAADPEIEHLNEHLSRISFEVEATEWMRIQKLDLFGAKSRRRFPAEDQGSGQLRITVEGSRYATESPRGWNAGEFVIISAMWRQVNAPEARWEGILFASAPAWITAVDFLLENGFMVDGETEDEISLTKESGTNVMISVYQTNQIASVVFAEPMISGSAANPSALMLVNQLNSSFVIGSVSLMNNEMGAEYLCVKSAIPVISGVDMAEVVATLVSGLIGMVSEIFPVLQRVLDGSLSVSDGVQLLT